MRLSFAHISIILSPLVLLQPVFGTDDGPYLTIYNDFTGMSIDWLETAITSMEQVSKEV